MSLTVKPMDQRMGDWEKHTKGMGSKLMMKMGYIIGTGLGKRAEGIINPVSAVIFPTGKSIDYCMNLRERSGGDKDLFSVERKMKRIQRKQENQSRKAYERDKKKEDLFTFINKTVQATGSQNDKLETRQDIKKGSSRDLNIRSMTIQEDIRKAERELDQLQSSLARHTDQTSEIHKKIRDKITRLLAELTNLQKQAQMIKNEQGIRENKKKLTVF
ncbi:unnamed protein product [Diabrotica balteata]|uniref:G-patch domain-containing protein n=1 Tax=Diabrotica balteata TaxID=107213 RepID=A0A9N9SZH3_DIABA|nr:unnamed protein product [Diabrotica balteata]